VAREFLSENTEELQFTVDDLIEIGVRAASGYGAVQYVQHLDGVPVYGAAIAVNVATDDQRVLSFFSGFDYEVPTSFDVEPDVSEKTAIERTVAQIREGFDAEVEVAGPQLYVYRHREPDTPGGEHVPRMVGKRPDVERAVRIAALATVVPEEGNYYLVWQVIAAATEPLSTSVEALVDARSGEVLVAFDRSAYVSGSGKVFVPDPVTSSGNTALVTSSPGSLTPTSTFDAEQQSVTLENLAAADGSGDYHLTGTYCRIKDDESPTFAPPSQSSSAFNYSVSSRHFLSVMAYYWIDRAQRFIKSDLGVSSAGDYQIEVDAQGMNGADNSHFVPGSSAGDGRIAFGEGGAPDASDAAVVLHEYGHAIHDHQGFPYSQASDLGEGFGDAFARVYLDRFNPNQVLREHVFPFDNNPSASYYWNSKRRVDRTESYSDSGFASYGTYLRGDIWATTVWQMYLALGGDSVHQAKRDWASDLVLKLHLEGNVGFAAGSSSLVSHRSIATQLEAASKVLGSWRSIPNGLFHKVIRDRCVQRGLFTAPSVDVYINDGRGGGYDYQENFWQSPDLVVRRSSTDSPTLGDQKPIVNQPNYLWVKVRRKGSGDPGAVDVKAFHCVPSTGLVWPTHWSAMSPVSQAATTLATSTEEWVGPFEFTPTQVGHHCILAVAEAANDPANTQGLVGTTPHWMLVPFDNNIAQRNLDPVSGGGGTKSSRAFRIINHSEQEVTAALDVVSDLPRTWSLEFDIPDIGNIPIAPHSERWVTMRVDIPDGQGFQEVGDGATVTLTALVEGIPDGGMTFNFVHPSLYDVSAERPPHEPSVVTDVCCACLGKLLEGADVEGEINITVRFHSKP
jgi:hypothetical protein